MNQSAAHTALLHKILLALGSRRDLLIWKNTTGQFRMLHSERHVNVGLPGSPDIIGVLATHDGHGVFLGIEVKTGTARLSEQQQAFHRRADEVHGILIVAHSVEEAVAGVEAARGAK